MTSWKWLKQVIDQKSVYPQFTEDNDSYFIKLIDGNLLIDECIINKKLNIEDTEDFELNYKNLSNKKLSQTDSDGTLLQRLKVTSSGWSLHYHGLEISTSTLNGVVDKDHNNQDFGFASIKLYDSNNEEITEQVNIGNCVKTVIDWEPNFSYDIIGAYVFQNTIPNTDIRVSVVGVPDIPANVGGSKVFMTGFNIKYLNDTNLTIDGRTPKSLVYNEGLHTNKIRLIFHHNAGTQHTILIVFNIFKA